MVDVMVRGDRGVGSVDFFDRPVDPLGRPGRTFGRGTRAAIDDEYTGSILRHHARAFLQLFCVGQWRDPAVFYCTRCGGGVLAIALRVPESMGFAWLGYYYHPRCGERFTLDGYGFYSDGKIK